MIRTFSLIASQWGVRAGLADMRSFLACAGLPDTDCGTAEIVLAEALNNVAEHAYDVSTTGTMAVTIEVHQSGVTIDIVDIGTPLAGLRLPTGHPPPLAGSRDELPEGGFGWFLIRSLTSGLNYTRSNGQNHLRLHLDLLGQNV